VKVRRGEVYFADLNPVTGSEQGGLRPVLVLQNDVGNQHSPTTIVAAITSRIHKARLPTHVRLPKRERDGLTKDSVILLEQLRTVDKQRLCRKVATLDRLQMEEVNEALGISLGLVL
jgi:mRNA interferase MazF